jgi:hypothetical protein
MLNLTSVRRRGRESVSLGRFKNRNLLKQWNFRHHGVEDVSNSAIESGDWAGRSRIAAGAASSSARASRRVSVGMGILSREDL